MWNLTISSPKRHKKTKDGKIEMVCTYRVRTDTVHDEARKAHTVYGIEAIGSGGEILLSIPDVFFNRQRAKIFANLCNSKGLSFLHFRDAVEDVLAE